MALSLGKSRPRMDFPETKGLKVTDLEIKMAVEEVDVTLTSSHIQTGITTTM